MTDADQEARQPTKWQVRQWLAERRADRSRTLPTPEELRRQLGWRLPIIQPTRKHHDIETRDP